MQKIKNFKELEVWQKSVDLVTMDLPGYRQIPSQ